MTALLVLKILLVLYIAQSLLKFLVHFLVRYETRIKRIEATYSHEGRSIKLFDDILLILTLVFVGLLVASGAMQGLSFATGLVMGLTLLQVYFHRFQDVLPPEKAPEPPVTPVRHMSYAIQANPANAWKEYLLMTIFLVGSLVMIIAEA